MNTFKWLNKENKRTYLCNVPSIVLELNNASRYGPNCWNATMLFFNPREEIRFVSPEEMTEWLEDNTIKDDMKLCTHGTILVLYGDKDAPVTINGLWHTAVFVGLGVLWHKYGCYGDWEFITEKQLRQVYPEVLHYEYRVVNENLKVK